MINLTFGEQVKIVLSRKGMTIKELAEQIEERTGKKMSRQNLTQRLGRDNFQEQDMRLIASILGCSFQLSILATAEAAEKASVIDEVPPTGRELEKMLAKQKLKMDRAYAKKQAELEAAEKENEVVEAEAVEETVPAEEAETEIVEIEAAPAEEVEAETEEPKVEVQEEEDPAVRARREEELKRAAAEWEAQTQRIAEREAQARREAEQEAQRLAEEAEQPAEPEVQDVQQAVTQQAEEPKKKESKLEKIAKLISAPKKDFQPIKQRADESEDLAQGDVNPYTGHEYQSNSVRMHPKRIGYVQVYDRKEHKWSDMTEWAFLGFEERKKATLGKDYEPPIYLD